MGYIAEHRGRSQHVFVPGTGQFPNSTLDREPRTVIHVKRAKMFDPMG